RSARRSSVYRDGAVDVAGAARRDRIALPRRAYPNARRIERGQRAGASEAGAGGTRLCVAAGLAEGAPAARRHVQAARLRSGPDGIDRPRVQARKPVTPRPAVRRPRPPELWPPAERLDVPDLSARPRKS